MRNKRFICLVGVLLISALVLSGCGGTTEEPAGDFAYVLNKTSEYARIVRYNGESAEVLIPDTLGGKPVKEIASSAFAFCPHVTSLTIPGSVTKIEDPSFYTLPALETINVAEDSVGFIVKDGVLYHKQMKTVYCYPQGKPGGSFTLPETITTVGARAFYHTKLKEIVMSKAVSKVYAYAFADSPDLASVAFSASLSQLYEGAFSGCAGLLNIVLPESLTSIGDDCFSGCLTLKTVTVPAAVSVIKERVFRDCTGLVSVDVLGSGYQRVAAETFAGCENLSQVTFAADLMGIAEGAFRGCKALEGIPMSDKLAVIGPDAFNGCERLADVKLPALLMQIGARAFEHTAWLESLPGDFAIAQNGRLLLSCRERGVEVIVPDGVEVVSWLNSDVISVIIPEGVITLSDGAFEDCRSLAQISLPASLVSIGARAFMNNSSLTAFFVPANVAQIGEGCFSGCGSIADYTVDPANITFIADQGVLYDNMKKYLIWYPAASGMSSYTVPYGAKRVTAGAVRGAVNLELFDASAAEELLEIDPFAFADCPKLKSVKFTNNFRKVLDYAFMNCVSLSEYDTVYTMTDIGVGAYQNCAALTQMTLNQPLAKIGENAFDGMPDCVFTVFAATPGEEFVKAYGLNHKLQ
jgi:hypothetical protein